MAFVPGFEYDIFISYTHRDNAPIGAGPGWVDQFHESLENWLAKRRGLSGLKIWRDPELDGNTEFNVAIERRLKSSAILLILHSRNYQSSEYCLKELGWFHQFSQAQPTGVRVGERLRILNILLNNIPHEDWPRELREFHSASGFPMHDAEDTRDLGDFTSPAEVLFEKQLRKVVDAAEATLRDLTRGASMVLEGSALKQTIPIFVAAVADSLLPTRDRLLADIGQRVQVLDDIPPPRDSERHQTRVREALSKVDLAIHLLDQQPGEIVVNDENSTYPRDQVEMSLAHPTPTLVWVPDSIDTANIRDEKQKALLAQLEGGERKAQGFEFIRCSRTALSGIVLQRIVALEHRPTGAGEAVTFLIDTHQKDQRYAYKLAEALSDQGADVDFNRESRNPIESLANFERAVGEVRNLIIMFGRVSSSWLQRRIQTAVKVVAEQMQSDRPSILDAIWVCLLPESTGAEAVHTRSRIINIQLLDNTHSDTIEPAIVSQLLGAHGQGDRP
jgi:hypothetical protein